MWLHRMPPISRRLSRGTEDDYVINGRKWFITNAHHPDCRIFIVMGKTDFDADSHRQQSMILVPMDTPGVELVRNITTINHHSPEGTFRGAVSQRCAGAGQQPDCQLRVTAL